MDASGRVLPTAIENRPPPGLVPAAREGADDTEGWRPTRAAGTAGGPIDDLVALDAARDPLAVAAVPRAFEGVTVREGPLLEGFVPSCFVGDLVGDLAMLPGRDCLGPGLGLGAFKLLLLPTPISMDPEGVLAPETNMLFGLAAELDFLAAAAAFGLGLGCSTTVTAVGRTNMPLPMAQSK